MKIAKPHGLCLQAVWLLLVLWQRLLDKSESTVPQLD